MYIIMFKNERRHSYMNVKLTSNSSYSRGNLSKPIKWIKTIEGILKCNTDASFPNQDSKVDI